MATGALREAKMAVPPAPIRCLVVEDHPLFRDALIEVLMVACPDCAIVQATSIEKAEAELAGDPADLVLLDLSMPGTTSLLGVMRIRKASPRSPVIVVSAHEGSEIVDGVMALGVAGFVPKSTPRPEIAAAIRRVMRGERCAPVVEPTIAKDSPVRSVIDRFNALTAQQLRVLDMVCRGLQNKHIAYELDISVTTVKVHVSEILRKLGVRSRTEAIIDLGRIDLARLAIGTAQTDA